MKNGAMPREHVFFKKLSFDFQALKAQTLPPPITRPFQQRDNEVCDMEDLSGGMQTSDRTLCGCKVLALRAVPLEPVPTPAWKVPSIVKFSTLERWLRFACTDVAKTCHNRLLEELGFPYFLPKGTPERARASVAPVEECCSGVQFTKFTKATAVERFEPEYPDPVLVATLCILLSFVACDVLSGQLLDVPAPCNTDSFETGLVTGGPCVKARTSGLKLLRFPFLGFAPKGGRQGHQKPPCSQVAALRSRWGHLRTLSRMASGDGEAGNLPVDEADPGEQELFGSDGEAEGPDPDEKDLFGDDDEGEDLELFGSEEEQEEAEPQEPSGRPAPAVGEGQPPSVVSELDEKDIFGDFSDDEPEKELSIDVNERMMPSADKALISMRLPNMLSFDEEQYLGLESITDTLMEGYKEFKNTRGQNVVSLQSPENCVRWRLEQDAYGNDVLDSAGRPVHESNCRLVQWEDGTWTLYVGSEPFNITEVKERIPIFEVNSQDVYVCHGAVSNKFIATPTSMKSESHDMLKKSQYRKHEPVRRSLLMTATAPVFGVVCCCSGGRVVKALPESLNVYHRQCWAT
ncbi:leo1 [Symbiodinium natans]|uniref:Leo1 protein n=1 Tax=Symbiodinium natans TaxID=878477 RepID=A0A812J3J0_9DINO|nr:leo1 [Symbiodinium natans]